MGQERQLRRLAAVGLAQRPLTLKLGIVLTLSGRRSLRRRGRRDGPSSHGVRAILRQHPSAPRARARSLNVHLPSSRPTLAPRALTAISLAALCCVAAAEVLRESVTGPCLHCPMIAGGLGFSDSYIQRIRFDWLTMVSIRLSLFI